MTDQRTLRALHDELRTACTELVDPIVKRMLRDDGSMTAHTSPSLLNQLHGAVAGNNDGSGGRRKGIPLPINVEAHDLLVEIRANTLEWCNEPSTEARIRTGVNLAGQWTEPKDILWVTSRLQRWVHAIRVLFDPPRRLHVAAACPACEVRMVWRFDDTIGERVQQAALQVDGQHGCECLACGHRWPTTHLEYLAKVIGCQPLPDEGGSAA